MSSKTVLQRLAVTPTLAAEDMLVWKESTEDMATEVEALLQGLNLKEVFGSSIMSLDEIRALFMKKIRAMTPEEKRAAYQKGAVMAGLSAMGNSSQVLRLMVKKEELRAMMTEMGVLASGRYNPTNPYNFPLSFYGRLFPEARHRVGAIVVSPRFTEITFKFLGEKCLEFAQVHLAQYVYPGGASAIPVISKPNAKKLYCALMTAVSLIISRKANGEGTWKSVSVEQTKQFMETVGGDGFGKSRGTIEEECVAFVVDDYLKAFCGAGTLYAQHPLYGAEKPAGAVGSL